MIEKHLRQIASDLVFSDSTEKQMSAYQNMMGHEGWETHRAVLIALFQGLGNDLLSSSFTNKPAEEKDVIQKVYYELSKIIKFLLNPMEEGRQQVKIQAHNQKMSQNLRKEK